jgi:MFS family permease
MLLIGIGAWVLLLPACLLVRPPPASAPAGAQAEQGGSSSFSVLPQILRSPQFLVLAFTFFACCAAHSGPIFHMVSYAMTCGIGPMAAVSIYSVEGAAGLGGRIVYGVLADRFGAKPVLIAGLVIQALVIAAYTQASELSQFYLLATIFGGTYGGVMPLYAVLARDYFGPAILGTVLGAATLLSSIGMAFGPLAGGWAFDHFASYEWLFIGSSLVGLGAAAIALAFPPLPRQPIGLQPA